MSTFKAELIINEQGDGEVVVPDNVVEELNLVDGQLVGVMIASEEYAQALDSTSPPED